MFIGKFEAPQLKKVRCIGMASKRVRQNLSKIFKGRCCDKCSTVPCAIAFAFKKKWITEDDRVFYTDSAIKIKMIDKMLTWRKDINKKILSKMKRNKASYVFDIGQHKGKHADRVPPSFLAWVVRLR